MRRLQTLFAHKKERVLNVYCTAGYPQLNSALPVMKALQNNGADIIELGIPYSDPLADGPVIQASNTRALDNGMSVATLLLQLRDLRQHIHIPVILMGYMNPILQYGFERFCAEAAAAGVDGLILPDMPVYEFEKEYRSVLKQYELDFIFLVTPDTSAVRIQQLDAFSSGFLYAVSASATTGYAQDGAAIDNFLQKIKQTDLINPVLVGFGIKDKAGFERVCQYANGAIIGSAYIRALSATDDIEKSTQIFLNQIVQ